MKRLGMVLALMASLAAAPATGPAYTNDFQQLQPGGAPDDLLILSGEFAIVTEGDNRFLRLQAIPLDSNGALAGPDSKSIASVSARIRGTTTARRFPEFGVGLAGTEGYKLWLMPTVGELQLVKGDDVRAHVSYHWTSGQWTRLRLQLRKLADGKWIVEGKAWPDGSPEPADWMIRMEETESPRPGRASIWGTAYSETPIDFDDLVVGAVQP